MDDHTTYPALLAAETVPVPLADQPALPADEPAAATWPGMAVKLAAAALGLWLLKRWW